jgi:hypothetical protein
MLSKDLLNGKTQYTLRETANKMKPRAQNLFKSGRAVSAVISNLILIGAVIAVGFSMLVWAQSQSSSYNNQYSQAVSADINQTKERIVFEYVYYDNVKNNLTVYLMNSGTIGNVNIMTVYVNSTPYSTINLKLLSTGAPTSSLGTSQEGYFSISPSPSLPLGKNYSIDVITRRGSSFVSTFAT